MHMMIDLETLSLKTNPMILSIGAALIYDDFSEVYASGQWNIDLDTYSGSVLDICPKTVNWWLKQPVGVTCKLFRGLPYTLKDALENLSHLYSSSNCHTVWANGAAEDLVWLQSAYESVGLETPWGYRDRMCYRTMRNMFPVEVERKPSLIEHVAEYDAIFQAEHLIEIVKNIKGIKP